MRITVENFERFSRDFTWNSSYDPERSVHTWATVARGEEDVLFSDIDRLQVYPHADTVTVSGLCQGTFEYLIEHYGPRLRALRICNSKTVEDWSLLGTLPALEFFCYRGNQRLDTLWDMSGNTALKGITLEGCTRLHSLCGIERAPALAYFEIGDVMWPTLVPDSFLPLRTTGIRHLAFYGKAIGDGDLSFLEGMPSLETFDFATNLFTTEQVAWIAANRPEVSGFAIGAMRDEITYDGSTYRKNVPAAQIIGKRKPLLPVAGNEAKIQRYIEKFERLKEQYRGRAYRDVFPQGT